MGPSEESHPGSTIWTINAELDGDDEGWEDADVHPIRDLDLESNAMRCEELILLLLTFIIVQTPALQELWC